MIVNWSFLDDHPSHTALQQEARLTIDPSQFSQNCRMEIKALERQNATQLRYNLLHEDVPGLAYSQKGYRFANGARMVTALLALVNLLTMLGLLGFENETDFYYTMIGVTALAGLGFLVAALILSFVVNGRYRWLSRQAVLQRLRAEAPTRSGTYSSCENQPDWTFFQMYRFSDLQMLVGMIWRQEHRMPLGEGECDQIRSGMDRLMQAQQTAIDCNLALETHSYALKYREIRKIQIFGWVSPAVLLGSVMLVPLTGMGGVFGMFDLIVYLAMFVGLVGTVVLLPLASVFGTIRRKKLRRMLFAFRMQEYVRGVEDIRGLRGAQRSVPEGW